MVGRVTAMALSHCGWFEILGILGTEWVFYADNHPFSCGDVMRFTRLHSEPLVCRRAQEAGLSVKCTCLFWNVPTWVGLCLLVPLVELWFVRMISWSEVAGTAPFKKVLMSTHSHIFRAVSQTWLGADHENRDRERCSEGREDQLPFVSLAVGYAGT